MKRFAFTCLSALSMFAFTAMGASYTGFIADAKCAAKNGAKTAAEGHMNCAANCIKGGEKAVLVTADGKIYQLTPQDKVTEHAGHKVTVDGKLHGTTITVADMKM